MYREVLWEIHLKTPATELFVLIKLQVYSCFPVCQQALCNFIKRGLDAGTPL